MNILMTYIRKYLWLNKSSTLTSILSLLTASALFFIVCCLNVNTFIGIHNAAVDLYGNYHVRFEDVDASFIESMKLHADVKEIHLVEFQKQIFTDYFPEGDKDSFAFIGMNQSDFESLGFILEEGRYPQNNEEVLLSSSTLDDTKVSLDIGETIELDDKQYVIVGIADTFFLENEASYHPLITRPAQQGDISLYVCYNNLIDAAEVTGKISQNFGSHFKSVQINEFTQLNQQIPYEPISQGAVAGYLFLMVFFLVVNVMLIRSAYRNSYANREKHLAILKTVGVTQSQCKTMILYEGLLILGISLILGSLAGFGVYYLLTSFTNSLLLSISLRSFTIGSEHMFICWFIMCVYIVLNALYFIKKGTSRIVTQSVSSTLHTSEEVVVVDHPYLRLDKKMSVIRRFLRKNIIQNYRSYVQLVVVMTAILALLILMNGFMGYLRDTGLYDVNDHNYDVEAIVESEHYPTSFMTQLKNSSASSVVVSEVLKAESSDWASFDNDYREFIFNEQIPLHILSYSDDILSEYLKNFSKMTLEDLENKGILINQMYSPAHRHFYNILKQESISDITISDHEAFSLDLILSEHLICGTGFHKMPQVIVTNQKMAEYYQKSGNTTHEYHIYFSSNDPTALVRELSVLDDSNLQKYSLINAQENQKDSKTFVTLIRLFTYGYIVCLLLMGILSVCCVAATNFDYRKKEFALYHVLGMRFREIMVLIFLEFLFYLLLIFLGAWLISQLLNYALYELYLKQFGLSFFIPENSLLGTVLAFFFLLIGGMCYIYIRFKTHKNSSVLKNEISLM